MTTSTNTKFALAASIIEDLKLAGAKMLGEAKRSFYAAMTIKHCAGKPRQAEARLGWNRHTVALGLHEQRTGIVCLGAYEACCGNKLWEERYPEAAQTLWRVGQTHSQQDPSFRTTLSYTRLTAAEALKQLRDLGALFLQPSGEHIVPGRIGHQVVDFVDVASDQLGKIRRLFQ